jgi:uroporphyrin-III C-methyltransferase
MAPALLAAVDSANHIHLIIGSNPLAGARCTRSIEVGARPKLVAPLNASLHYGITKRIEEGQVEWTKRGFQDEDLTTLGREEVDGVVDAVFVTLASKDPLSTCAILMLLEDKFSPCVQALTYPISAEDCVYP